MSLTTARAIISTIFITCLVATIFAIVLGQRNNRIEAENFNQILMLTAPVYIANLGIIIGKWYSPKAINAETVKEREMPIFPAIFGIVCVILWNSLIAGRMWLFINGGESDDIGSLLTYLQTVVPILSPLISAVLASLFNE